MTNERWNVDLHSHTLWSKDCLTPFETIIHRCQRRGVDRIAITDHNTAEGALAMQKIAPELVIVGEEIMTTQGEILGYFLTESVPAGLTPEETIKRLRNQGAVISVSHPFDRYRKGAWEEADLRRIMGLVDAIEVFNARCVRPEDNQQAAEFARQNDLIGTAGSDAHTSVEYGQAMTRLQPFQDAESFRQALQTAEFVERLSPFYVHFGSTYAKWMKKLGLKPRLWAGG
ncbi:MAG: PHP domain-containing protein [Anaerolineaceae bacterium]|nr:PHP domain-containing protein [Anaerolineaceae bacterium]